MRLEGRTAFITGASRNIGRAIALAFAAEGASLVVNTRVNRDELESVAEECRKAGARVVTALGDIADAAAVERMVEEGQAELGAIDVLVCNAAIRPHKSIAETSLEDWHHVMGVNLHSAFYLARAVIPGMKERRRGSIIALGGQSSLTGRPNTAAVTAAKTGMLGLVRALAAELGPFGIRANMVIPGHHGHRAALRGVVSGVPPGPARERRAAEADSPRAAGPAGGDRGCLRVSRLGRLRLHHGRRDPRDGRADHWMTTRARPAIGDDEETR
jgi:3-oxoacyl-[acyl-carrier protein] reductase